MVLYLNLIGISLDLAYKKKFKTVIEEKQWLENYVSISERWFRFLSYCILSLSGLWKMVLDNTTVKRSSTKRWSNNWMNIIWNRKKIHIIDLMERRGRFYANRRKAYFIICYGIIVYSIRRIGDLEVCIRWECGWWSPVDHWRPGDHLGYDSCPFKEKVGWLAGREEDKAWI